MLIPQFVGLIFSLERKSGCPSLPAALTLYFLSTGIIYKDNIWNETPFHRTLHNTIGGNVLNKVHFMKL